MKLGEGEVEARELREWLVVVSIFAFLELGLAWSHEGCIYHINTPAS